MRAGICDFVRTLCQTFDDLPCDGIAFLLVSFKGDLIALIMLLAFLSIPVVVILRLGRLGHNIGAHLIDSVIILGVGVSNVVLTRRHLDVHIVAAGGGGNRFALVGAVQQGHIRIGIVVIFAGVGHRFLGGIVLKVRIHRRVADRILAHNNRTGLVLSALFCNDGSLIAAKHVRIRYLVGKGLAFVYTGNALELKCAFANAFWAGQREGAIPVRVGLKVIQLKALKGQLFSYGVALRQRVIAAIVVSATLHHKPDVVGACLGGHRLRSSRKVICSAVLKGSLRSRIAEILRAGIDCRTSVEVKAEVRACRLVRPCTLIDLKFAALVQRALFGTDVHLINAVHIRMREVAELLFVVGTYKDNARLAHAFLFAGNARDERAPVDVKVILGQRREGQLLDIGQIHKNILSVILGGKGQGLAVCGKLCTVVIAGSRTIDVCDCIAEGELCLGVTDKVNRVCCYGIAVDGSHRAIADGQFALLLTVGKIVFIHRLAADGITNRNRAASEDQLVQNNRIGYLHFVAVNIYVFCGNAGHLGIIFQKQMFKPSTGSSAVMPQMAVFKGTALNGNAIITVKYIIASAGDGGFGARDHGIFSKITTGQLASAHLKHKMKLRAGRIQRGSAQIDRIPPGIIVSAQVQNAGTGRVYVTCRSLQQLDILPAVTTVYLCGGIR